MKAVGIIVEYNPLHNGHLHHIQETRRLSNCDYLICVMSGNFMQRGEPAILDKFTRTKLALENGIDMVVELPFVFTVQNADIFAYTSVSILHELGVDEIYFGSETGDIKELQDIGEILSSDAYNHLVKEYMSTGNSYPTSSDLAMKQLSSTTSFDLPNNILGIQYLLAGKKLSSTITFHTIKRVSTNYYDDITEKTFIQSATAIRKAILLQKDVSDFVPTSVNEALNNNKPVTLEGFYDMFTVILRREDKTSLERIFGMNEGLENRILKIKEYGSVESLITQILSRRYTNSKIKRVLAHLLCNIKKDDIPSFEVPYIRVLGMNEIGKDYLNRTKKEICVPLVTKAKEGIHPYLDIEIKVSKLYDLVGKNSVYKNEFLPVIIKYFS